MLLFAFCGCDTDYLADTNNDIQVEVADDVVKDKADTNKASEQESSSQSSGKPREDLEVEVAPGITSNYGLMRVHFIDVGQADSAFIELGNGQTMLIDAGRSGNASTIINYIKGLQYETIDYVVASHPHDDHIGGMATVLDSFNIGKMYMPKQAHNAPQESFFGHMKDEIDVSECSKYREVKAIVDDWMDYYNNSRYQWQLAKLSPNEYYEYITTGIYPLEGIVSCKVDKQTFLRTNK